MTWRCVPVACWHKAPHIAAAAFGALLAAHPMPAGRASCRCHMVWYPDAAPLTTPAPRDTLAPLPAARFDREAPVPVFAPAPPVVSAPWQDIPAPGLPPDIAPASQPPTPMPEPASWALLAAGVAMLLRARSRRRA